MNTIEAKLAPAIVAVVVVVAAVVLAVKDHSQMAWAVTLVGLVGQSFLPPVVRQVPPAERITDPDLGKEKHS